MSLLHTIGLLAHRLFSRFPEPHPQREVIAEKLGCLVKLVTTEQLNLQHVKVIDPVEYYNIYESDVFTLCVFALKGGTTMPTHDHPQMMVFSKVIRGDLRVRTYQFAEDESGPHTVVDPESGELVKVRSAHASRTRTIPSTSPDSLLVIRPDGGPNMHSFTAASPEVMILDVIGPPYNLTDRPCTYYRELARRAGTGGRQRRRASGGVVRAGPPQVAGLASVSALGEAAPVASREDTAAGSAPATVPTRRAHPIPPVSAAAPRMSSSLPSLSEDDDDADEEADSDSSGSPRGTSAHPAFDPSLDALDLSACEDDADSDLVWLAEAPDVDYDCVERAYMGPRIFARDMIVDASDEEIYVLADALLAGQILGASGPAGGGEHQGQR
ncbi:hypothetical protein BDK51DRAFT_30841 [Blyttiomyces helicus]|uniref:RmlC-like cupin domain-containing protein n=1 Tax=Blyttiomyces helicus TaxID=388810 RepID=A0A4P9WFZ6_9FUNG|nr:hypothetical protein BDK51DRAFT_30841 [Blyttiomyces helicus]|eukprot:RKO91594.1 hypothetical protein BDK51DRAFT_30841 [Blyttiomyces helicus]